MSADSRRFVLHALVVLAILGVVLSTAWVVFWASFTLDSAGPSPTMVRQEALAAAIGSALLVATVIPMRAVRIAGWVFVLDVTLAGLLALFAIIQFDAEGHGQDFHDGNPWSRVVWMFLVTPTTWPVLALLLTTPLLRGRSRPAPRSVQAR